MSHPIVHVELPAEDKGAAAKFYSDLFGWQTQVDEQFDYAMFQPQDGPGGGFSPLGDDVVPGDVIVYVGTDDIEATLDKATSLGGEVVTPKMEIPGSGWLAIFRDPTGNRIGLWKGVPEG
jgi:predicted enzyme related to lactoylglutathione lyase